jgi:uncharacterized protein (TIGR00251 family)
MTGDSRMRELPPWIRAQAPGVQLFLRVQPGARRSAVVGVYGERLKVAVQAPPLDGRANEELLRYLALSLQLRAGDLQVEAGSTSRDKRIGIRCDPAAAQALAQTLAERLGALISAR